MLKCFSMVGTSSSGHFSCAKLPPVQNSEKSLGHVSKRPRTCGGLDVVFQDGDFYKEPAAAVRAGWSQAQNVPL